MQAGEPPSLLAQNFWQTLSRSEQVFASAGPMSESARTPIAPATTLQRKSLRTRLPRFWDNATGSQVRRRIADWQRRAVQSERKGSAPARRPAVHRAAAVRRLSDIDNKLIVVAAAEFQRLARPFISGQDAAALHLG